MITLVTSLEESPPMKKTYLILYHSTQSQLSKVIPLLILKYYGPSKKLKNNAPGESGIPAWIWKHFSQDPILFDLLRDIILNFWNNENSHLNGTSVD